MYKNLHDWLCYIEQRYICRIDLGLERIRKVAVKLKITSFSCPIVVVAGTNGKGSCVAYLESILSAAGYKVGSYTSPHLLHFNERVHINGKEIDDWNLCNAFTVIDKVCKDAQLTYFEFVTLAALYIFKLNSLDILLLEIGLGGRLDAVNIIDADIAVITTVAIDHIEYLGNDRELVGYEKAGIVRDSKPVVCGDFKPPESVIQRAKFLKAPLYCLGREFGYSITNDSSWRWYSGNTKLNNLPLPSLSLQSAATSLMVIILLQPWLSITKKAIISGLKNVFLPGRFQCLSNERSIILDVAHNPEAAAFLAIQIASIPCEGHTLAVVGMLKDKDILGTLQPMTHLINAWYFGDLNVPRGAKAEHLEKYLRDLSKQQCYTYKSISEAYNQAVANCTKKDRILVFGSFYTVAEVLKEVNNHGYTC
jgi:dihydrofolate synthase/folylpolyglutamate synthase